MRNEVQYVATQADRIQVSMTQNILEVATSLNQMFKIIRPAYIQGQEENKELASYLTPTADDNANPLMEARHCFWGDLTRYEQAEPIGDGVGAMIAGRFMLGKEKIGIERETVFSKTRVREYQFARYESRRTSWEL